MYILTELQCQTLDLCKNFTKKEYKFTSKNAHTGIVVAPTGSGKTVIFAQLCKDLLQENKTIYILMHRTELISQTYSTLLNMQVDQEKIGMYTANVKNITNNINLISIAAFSRNIKSNYKKFNHRQKDAFVEAKNMSFDQYIQHVDVIIIDECHHMEASGYQKIISWLHKKNNNLKIIGFTATPIRLDTELIFDEYINILSYQDVLAEGRIVPPRFLTINDHAYSKIQRVKKSKGEYSNESMSILFQDSFDNFYISFKEYAINSKRTVVFCIDVKHANECHTFFKEKIAEDKLDIKTAILHSQIDQSERQRILYQFKIGMINILFNVEILTEGWDCPEVDTMMILRPTTSLALAIQIIGRGLRHCENKKDVLILDFAGFWHMIRGTSLAKISNFSQSITDPFSPLKAEKIKEQKQRLNSNVPPKSKDFITIDLNNFSEESFKKLNGNAKHRSIESFYNHENFTSYNIVKIYNSFLETITVHCMVMSSSTIITILEIRPNVQSKTTFYQIIHFSKWNENVKIKKFSFFSLPHAMKKFSDMIHNIKPSFKTPNLKYLNYSSIAMSKYYELANNYFTNILEKAEKMKDDNAPLSLLFKKFYHNAKFMFSKKECINYINSSNALYTRDYYFIINTHYEFLEFMFKEELNNQQRTDKCEFLF